MDMIEIHQHTGEGYKRLVEYQGWVAAVLNHAPTTTPEGVIYFEKHMLTDEVFVLLQGSCTLLEAGNGEHPGEIHAVPLEPCKFYNVKAGVWHSHMLSKDAAVAVIENIETGTANSVRENLTEDQRAVIAELWYK